MAEEAAVATAAVAAPAVAVPLAVPVPLFTLCPPPARSARSRVLAAVVVDPVVARRVPVAAMAVEVAVAAMAGVVVATAATLAAEGLAAETGRRPLRADRAFG